MRRLLFVLGVLALCVQLQGCYALGRFSPLRPLERSLVFYPTPLPENDPVCDQIEAEDVWFTASDGVRLNGWYVHHPESKATILVCHGNGGNVSDLAETLKIMNQRHHVSVMAFDYRGYGKSQGTPSEEGLYKDARAARAWLARRENIAETEIVLAGQSLGGGVAVDLAAKDGARGLILASTFASLPQVASAHMPIVPAGWLMTFRFNSVEKIRQYHGPLLISHGDADELIPIQQGRSLFEAAGSERKKFVRIPGGRHNDPQPEEYRQEFEDFLNDLGTVEAANSIDSAHDHSGQVADS